MNDLASLFLFLAAWVVLQRFLLPRLGVGT
jgi:hypothetical protein